MNTIFGVDILVVMNGVHVIDLTYVCHSSSLAPFSFSKVACPFLALGSEECFGID